MKIYELNDNFRTWFGNSKVVDNQGNPLIVYHGTYKDFDEFYIGSHFGDVNAANDRLSNTISDRPGGRFTSWHHDGAIIPVYLSIQNPLRIIDDAGLSDGYDLELAVRKTGVITTAEGNDITHTTSPTIAKRRLFDKLSEKGYDGLVYKNTVEGNGDSWIPFTKNQVKSIFNSGNFSKSSDKIQES